MSHPTPAAGSAPDAVTAAADRLLAAQAAGVPCPPVRDLIGRTDVHAAYAVQQRVVRAHTAAGGRVAGRKIGLTSPAVQAQLGVDRPDFGVLFADMQYPDGAAVPADSILQPRAEAEIAFVLGADLADGDLTLGQVRAAVDHAVAAIEICGSRIAGWDISFADTVADNASAGAYVLGTERRSLREFEPREAAMTMSVDGEQVSAGDGAACLGDPLLALQWLARQARDLGDPLRAGQVVLSGALGPMRAVGPGSTVEAVVAPLGTVRFTLGGPTEGAQR
ncbi:2-keto-4-pentenoate hydratase [Kitasatospora cineracea]|uniref:2-oxo-3-hexenedioate decarboxylase/2-keto-4-pentenoate hydratase n=1 Tax=Kitasatospora cineracea TaxID=88074 RepID=A0A8G1XCR4_9ACTN|nr:fumarylacetoacetate hydrolase family protein [Kitasatospora cineracea]ROR45665.1 2-oxo-3-hexenedioate decarboxylase/2-keto-4-pentenoate hydratase [Kitasatospora cineracea]